MKLKEKVTSGKINAVLEIGRLGANTLIPNLVDCKDCSIEDKCPIIELVRTGLAERIEGRNDEMDLDERLSIIAQIIGDIAGKQISIYCPLFESEEYIQ
jgi:hypothetical protein